MMEVEEQKGIMNHLWVLYDGRYHINPNRAIVYCTARSREQAIKYKSGKFPDAVIVMYETKGKELINGRIDYKAMKGAP